MFRQWPSSTTAGRLHGAAGASWPEFRDEVLATLANRPRDAVLFALMTLKDVQFAWELAHSLALDCGQTWSELAKAYEKVDRLAVLPIHQRLVEGELVEAEPSTTGWQLGAWSRCAGLPRGAKKPRRSTPWLPTSARRTVDGLASGRSSITPACPETHPARGGPELCA